MTYKDPALISQFANSKTLNRLISDFQGNVDPSPEFQKFLSFVWSLRTAESWGLDILGRIVGISRVLKIPYVTGSFGFLGNGVPFNQGAFYQKTDTQNYKLTDDAYRLLIAFKAHANIGNGSAPSINKSLNLFFANRGRCYCSDIGGMQMLLTFEFQLQPYELAMLTDSTANPRPAAVDCYIRRAQNSNATFGFTGNGQPFGQGTFFNPQDLIRVT